MVYAGDSHIGKARELNEDSYIIKKIDNDCCRYVFVVADGMGGHKAGEFASQKACEFLTAYIEENIEAEKKDIKRMLRNAINKVNRELYDIARKDKEKDGMGTTVVLCLVDAKNKLYIANVGDSRMYILRDEYFTCITEDHSYVNDLLKMGELTKEEALNHPKKNMITRAVGYEPRVKVDIFEEQFIEDDVLLLCSDGLTNMVSEEKIKDELLRDTSSKEKVKTLIDMANKNGGKDNIAVIIIE